MKKKIITSLLVSPLAFGAMAGITPPDLSDLMSGAGWNQSGVSGSTNVFKGGEVTCPIGAGDISRPLGKLYPGTYTVTISGAKNAKITVAGKEFTPATSGEETFEFKVSATSEQTLTVSPVTIAEYGFKGLSVELVFDFTTVKLHTLSTLVNPLDPETCSVDEETLEAAKEKIAEIQSIIETFLEGSAEAQWKAYGKYEMWKGPAAIDALIDASNATVDALNKTIVADNEAYKIAQADKAIYDQIAGDGEDGEAIGIIPECENEIEGLEDKFDAVLDEIKDPATKAFVTAYASPKAAAERDEWANAFKTLKDKVDAAYKAGEFSNEVKIEEKDEEGNVVSTTTTTVGQQLLEEAEALQKEFDTYSKEYGKQFITYAENYLEVLVWQGELNPEATVEAGTLVTAKAAEDEINMLTGISSYESVFDTKKAGWIEDLRAAYAANKKIVDDAATVAVPEYDPEKAKDYTISAELVNAIDALNAVPETEEGEEPGQSMFAEAQEAAEAAFTEIGDYVKDLQGKVDGQNELMTQALEAVNEVKVPTTTSPAIDALISAQIEKFETIKADLRAKYAALTLSKDDVDACIPELAAINNALNDADLNNAIDAYNTAMAEYTEIEQAIAEGIDYEGSPIAGVFDATMAQIKAAIDAITKDTNVEPITVALNTAEKNVGDMADALKSVDDKLKAYNKEYNKYTGKNGSVEKIKVLDGADVKVAKTEFSKEYTQLNADFKALSNKGQATYTALTELDKALPASDGVTNHFNALLLTYAQAVVDANAAVVGKDVKALKKVVPTDKEPGYNGYEIFNAEVDKINDEFTTAIEKEVATGTANQIVNGANEITGDLEKVLAAIDLCNWAGNQLKALSPVPTDLAEATDANEMSWSPAKEYFTTRIADLRKEREDYVNAIQTALDNSKNEDENLDTNIKNLCEKAAGLAATITANHSAYIGLLATAESTANHIATAQSYLDDLKSVVGAVAADFADWQKQIDSFNTTLGTINVDLSNNYGTGNLGNVQADLSKRYSDLDAAISILIKTMLGESDDITSAVNGEYLEVWLDNYRSLRREYKTAIDAFNNYSSKNITNAGLYAALVEAYEGIGNHQEVYAFSANITALDQYVQNQIKAAKAPLTQAEYAAIIAGNSEKKIEGADALMTGMKDIVTEMTTAVTNAAEAYYEAKLKLAQGKCTDAVSDMTGAGITGTLEIPVVDENGETKKDEEGNAVTETVSIADYEMESVNDFVDALEAFHNYNGEDAKIKDIVLRDNEIMNQLDTLEDKIVAAQNAAAKAQWSQTYGEDAKTVGEYTEDIEGLQYPYNEEDMEEFNDAKSEVTALSPAPAFADFTETLSELKGHMADLKTAYDKIMADEAAQAAAAATVEDLSKQIGTLRAEYAELEKTANGLAGKSAVTGINAALNGIEADINASKNIVAEKDALQARIDGVKSDIDNGFDTLVASEKKSLNEVMDLIRIAFNNVRANATIWDKDQANAENAAIDELQKQVDALNITVVEPDPEDPDVVPVTLEEASANFKADALGLETTLTDKLAELEKLLPDNKTTADQYDSNLGGECQSAIDTINEDKGKLGDDVKAEYEPKYDALISQINALDNEIAALGDKIVLYKDEFSAKIAAIVAKAAPINTEAAALQDIYDYTKVNKAKVQEALDEATATLEKASQMVATWNVPEWGVFLGTLNKRISAIQTSLNNECTVSIKNGNGTYTHTNGLTQAEVTDYLNLVSTVDSEMEYYVMGATVQYVDDSNTAAKTAIANANKALTHEVVDKYELQSQVATEEVKLETAKTELKDALKAASELEDATDAEKKAAGIAAYEAFAEKALEIKEAVDAIVEKIKENTYVVGDVDGDGLVDTADLQTLVNWIGNLYTLSQIGEEYGVAIEAAANVNGAGDLNIADLTALNQLIIDGPDSSPLRYMAPRMGEGQAIYSLARTSEENRTRVYSLSMSNTGDFIGAQIDVKLPSGMELVEAKLSERAAGHTVQVFDNGNGAYRLVIWSAENAAFEGTAGELVTLVTEGIGTPEVTEMVLSTPKHSSVIGGNEGMSMLDSIIEGTHNVKERIYDAAGRSLNAVKRGINIIRHSDGSTTKELRK